jgi:hypothetical protein
MGLKYNVVKGMVILRPESSGLKQILDRILDRGFDIQAALPRVWYGIQGESPQRRRVPMVWMRLESTMLTEVKKR